jgi:hypothetical protein
MRKRKRERERERERQRQRQRHTHIFLSYDVLEPKSAEESFFKLLP